MAKVLVTGGKGFLGGHIAARLRARGDQVRVFARENNNDSFEEGQQYEVCYGDIRDVKAVEEAVKGVDYVIHTVSNFRRGGSDKDDAYSTNVEGTENVLKASERYQIRQLIHCSTIGVHGSVLEVPANEETSYNPTDLYQETKLIAEKTVWEFYKKTQLPITVVRPISLFGPGDVRMLKLFRLIQQGRFFIIGDGEVLFHPSYIDDVVRGFLLCLGNEKAIGEAFIIGGEGYLTLNELCQLIAKELKVAPPNLHIPMAPMVAAATLCEKIFVPLGFEPPLHRRRMSFFQNHRAFSIEKAKQRLAYHPEYSLEEGIRATIHWYRTQRWL